MEFGVVETGWGCFSYVVQEGRLLKTVLPRPREAAESTIREALPEARFKARLMPDFERRIGRYFLGEPVIFPDLVELDSVPPFHRRVLEACRTIPFGQTVTYRELAALAGNPNAARAVGGAMAHNPLPLVIPCHRVVGSSGSLGGFSTPGGTALKRRLLKLEAKADLVGRAASAA